ncbi:hypothetical protein DMX04_14495 [Pseudomonas koreensis]|nr:hypothetical protein DMX04_14495 [Pseudomonas koreensis]
MCFGFTQSSVTTQNLWRGDLSPLGGEATLNPFSPAPSARTVVTGFTTAAQPNGDKSPRHKNPAERG